jgi:hypothetical protein
MLAMRCCVALFVVVEPVPGSSQRRGFYPGE